MSVAPWIQIMGGKIFDYANLDTRNVHATDIAHALGRRCRYLDRVIPGMHYSVAEHCVHIARCAARKGESWDMVLWSLLHDATEAYMPDFPRPWKEMPEFKAVVAFEDKLMRLIAERFDLEGREVPEWVDHHDSLILFDEATQVLDAPPVDNWHLKFCPGMHVKVEFWPATEASLIYFQMLSDVLVHRENERAAR